MRLRPGECWSDIIADFQKSAIMLYSLAPHGILSLVLASLHCGHLLFPREQ